MDFDAVLDQLRVLLQSKGRMTYRALKRRFDVDEEYLADLTAELIEAERVAIDEEGKVLVWVGDGAATSEESPSQTGDASAPGIHTPALSAQPEQDTPAGERRQLTVMFCDLVGSTTLSEQLDPEELQTVVRTYQEVSAQVIERYDGHIAQYLGDGLLVYFGYPAAHEDDAARSIRTGLEIVTALDQARSQFPKPVQVRIGIHTGPVVVGQMGGGSRHEQLALGETPNIAARVQGQAQPDEVVISAATQRLVAGLFETEDRGRYELKGISTPQPLYRVTAESSVQSRFGVALQAGLTPLVGRDHELGVLRERWTQAQAGNGQVVLLSGEPGIGKSRLVQELKGQVTQDGAKLIEFHCSPYHQNSALYPFTSHLQRLLQFAPDETPETKLAKLQQLLGHYRFPQADTLPLLAAFLSLPHPAGVPPLTVSPQKQKELTHTALVAWLIEETEQQPVYMLWEDVHWADPSTLEVLGLLLRQVPTTPLLAVLTFRSEFVPPWGTYTYMNHLTLSRLGDAQVSSMVERVTEGRALPPEVVEQVAEKTDGIPLFVEELTKMIVESGGVRAVNNHYELTGPLSSVAIPATLSDSLMARLDRLPSAKAVAQLGATIGREFGYDLLQAVSSLDETALKHGLQQLVDAELVYQHGLPPQATYLFKHALIQDTAYQSLLKRTRQQYHQQIAEVLVERFPETPETAPDLVAHHYTEANLTHQALPYWLRAGQQATQRSANVEAISHLTTGLALLKTLPATPERDQQELALQIALGAPLMAAQGYGSPEMRQAYDRARELCQHLDGESSQLFLVLFGLLIAHFTHAEHQLAREVGEELLRIARRQNDSALLLEALYGQGMPLRALGEFVLSRAHVEQAIALYDPQEHHSHAYVYGQDPGVTSRAETAAVLWHLGYPDESLRRVEEALLLAKELGHPLSLVYALSWLGVVHQFRGEGQEALARFEAVIALSTEYRFPDWVAQATVWRGWTLTRLGQSEEDVHQIRQGSATFLSLGAELFQPWFMAMLAEAYGKRGQIEEGLTIIAEALEIVSKLEEYEHESELYRLKGQLTLQANGLDRAARHGAAEACFQRAMEIAQRQEAKSFELRAATSLARLWQSQGKQTEARELLAVVYEWFTEGFDTADLKDAKALLQRIS